MTPRGGPIRSRELGQLGHVNTEPIQTHLDTWFVLCAMDMDCYIPTSSRAKQKAKEKAIKGSVLYAYGPANPLFPFLDTYFFVQWVDDTEKFDVVNSKHVVPPDGIEVLNVKPEMVCRVACDGTFHKASMLEVG